jgi:hypothetical protein
MNTETGFAFTVISAVFVGLLGFFWWFFRDYLGRLQTRTDNLIDHFSQFKLAGRLTLIDEKVNVAMKKSEEHGTALLLLMPRVAVLEEEEQLRQKREDPPGPPAPSEGSFAAAQPTRSVT